MPPLLGALRLYRVVPERGPQGSREELHDYCTEHRLCNIKSTCEGKKHFKAFIIFYTLRFQNPSERICIGGVK